MSLNGRIVCVFDKLTYKHFSLFLKVKLVKLPFGQLSMVNGFIKKEICFELINIKIAL